MRTARPLLPECVAEELTIAPRSGRGHIRGKYVAVCPAKFNCLNSGIAHGTLPLFASRGSPVLVFLTAHYLVCHLCSRGAVWAAGHYGLCCEKNHTTVQLVVAKAVAPTVGPVSSLCAHLRPPPPATFGKLARAATSPRAEPAAAKTSAYLRRLWEAPRPPLPRARPARATPLPRENLATEAPPRKH